MADEAKIAACMAACPEYPDFPTAWAIQEAVGATLLHNPRCSSVPGWCKISGPAFLCDCGAVAGEWVRRKKRVVAGDLEYESWRSAHAG
jgi:hypothetical protein